jgi:DNA-binding NarL/FixJ family response regulator
MEIQQAMNEKRIDVLLVDDGSHEHTATKELAAATSTMQFSVDHVTNYDEAIVAIDRNRHDVYLIDNRLDSRSGLELLGEAISRGCTRPVFILGDGEDYAIDLQASELGASGFFERDRLDGVVLERSIRYALSSRSRPAGGSGFVARSGDLQLQVALARGATVRDAANTAGVAERTAHRRLSDPSFRAEVDRLREELRLKIIENVAAQLSKEQFGESDGEGSLNA